VKLNLIIVLNNARNVGFCEFKRTGADIYGYAVISVESDIRFGYQK
jgi:hypothetical protein